jgi:hypothetical protein
VPSRAWRSSSLIVRRRACSRPPRRRTRPRPSPAAPRMSP